METQKILIALLGLLVVVAAVQMMQINKLNDRISGQATMAAASSVSSAAASGDDTYAKMMKEHHGIDVNAQQTPAKTASALDSVPNMVGGC